MGQLHVVRVVVEGVEVLLGDTRLAKEAEDARVGVIADAREADRQQGGQLRVGPAHGTHARRHRGVAAPWRGAAGLRRDEPGLANGAVDDAQRARDSLEHADLADPLRRQRVRVIGEAGHPASRLDEVGQRVDERRREGVAEALGHVDRRTDVRRDELLFGYEALWRVRHEGAVLALNRRLQARGSRALIAMRPGAYELSLKPPDSRVEHWAAAQREDLERRRRERAGRRGRRHGVLRTKQSSNLRILLISLPNPVEWRSSTQVNRPSR